MGSLSDILLDSRQAAIRKRSIRELTSRTVSTRLISAVDAYEFVWYHVFENVNYVTDKDAGFDDVALYVLDSLLGAPLSSNDELEFYKSLLTAYAQLLRFRRVAFFSVVESIDGPPSPATLKQLEAQSRTCMKLEGWTQRAFRLAFPDCVENAMRDTAYCFGSRDACSLQSCTRLAPFSSSGSPRDCGCPEI